MEPIERLKELMLLVERDSNKLFEKNNRSAGERSRAALLEMGKLIIPSRKSLLTKLKSIPRKPRKK